MAFNVESCPYCGSKEIRVGYQINDGEMVSDYAGNVGCRIIHYICLGCGGIAGSRVEKPEIFNDSNVL